MSLVETAPQVRPLRGSLLRLVRSELRLVLGRRRNLVLLLGLALVPLLLGTVLFLSQDTALQGQGPGFATHICDVEVDRETGHVKILRYTAIQDVGRAIHPSYVEGQMQGGVTQGIGWALSEEYVYDKQGRLDNAGFLDYRVPVASDLPMIEAVMVENANPRHPFGARGVGEVPIVPPMAAVANAIADAIGVRMRDLPMSPPKLRAALDAQDLPRLAAE